MVENIGRKKGNTWHCLGVAYSTHPIRHVFYDETYSLTGMLVVSALALDCFSKEWRQKPLTRRLQTRRRFSLTVVVCIYLLVWSIYFYLNNTIKDSDGDEVSINEAFTNFINSQWWTDWKLTFSNLWQHARHHEDKHGRQQEDEHARQRDDEHDRRKDDEIPNVERFNNLSDILDHQNAFTVNKKTH